MATDVASTVAEASSWAKDYCTRLADMDTERPVPPGHACDWLPTLVATTQTPAC